MGRGSWWTAGNRRGLRHGRVPTDRGPRPDRRPADRRPGLQGRRVDWFCCPRFDSPSVFASLLDSRRGGVFRIAPSHCRTYTSRQLYFPDTAVLITRFMTEDGVGEVVDFMPVRTGRWPTDNHRIVRIVRCVRGQMDFQSDIAPRFDYARIAPRDGPDRARGGVQHAAGLTLTLHAVRDPDDERLTRWDVAGRRRRPRDGRPCAPGTSARRGAGVGGRRAAAGDPGRRGGSAGARDRRVLAPLAARSRRTPAGGGRRCSARPSR